MNERAREAGWRPTGTAARVGGTALLAVGLLVAGAVFAAEPEEPARDRSQPRPEAGAAEGAEAPPVLVPAQEQRGAPGPPVALDDLLRLPTGYGADTSRRGGVTRQEWRERFDTARADAAAAKQKLVELNAELDQVSSSAAGWQVAAPGSSDPQTSPLSLRLRQDIRSQREKIEEAERRLRALHVEADLAAVPPDWRGAPSDGDDGAGPVSAPENAGQGR